MIADLERLPEGMLRRPAQRQRLPSHEYLGLVAVIVLAAGFNAVTLFRYPRPLIDEAELVGRAWSYVQRGFNLAPVHPLSDPSSTPAPFQLLGSWIFSVPVRFFGPNLWAVRAESLVFGLALLVAIYFIGRRLYGGTVGVLAAGLVAFSDSFIMSTHIARYDVIIALVGYGAIALVLFDAGDIPFRSALGGLLLGLSFEMHGNAALYGPAVVLLLFVEHGIGILKSRRLYGFVGGVCVGLTLFAVLHVIPRSSGDLGGLNSLVFSAGAVKRPPITVLDPGIWLASAADTVGFIVSFARLRTPLLAAAVLLLMARRNESDLRLLALLVGLTGGVFAVLSYKPFYYEIILSPMTDIIMAAFIAELWRRLSEIRPGPRWQRLLTYDAAMVLVSTLLVLGAVTTMSAQFKANSSADVTQTDAVLRRVLPGGARLVGDHTLWFGLADYQWTAWSYLPVQLQTVPGSSLADAYRALGGDYLIVGPDLLWNVTDDPGDRPYWARWQNISKNDWDSFIARYGELVTSVTTQSLGEVSVYKIRSN